MKILFVCLGNICRSPSAEGVMRDLVAKEGLADSIEIDSAGTGDWHVGKNADPRAIEAASLRGIELTSRGRQVSTRDFEEFDLIVAMDRNNHADLLALNGGDGSRLRLLREIGEGQPLDVPDPYYGGDDGFEEVLDLLELNCRALLAEVNSQS